MKQKCDEGSYRGVLFKGITSRYCSAIVLRSKISSSEKQKHMVGEKNHFNKNNYLFSNQQCQNAIGLKLFSNRAVKTSMTKRKSYEERKILQHIGESLQNQIKTKGSECRIIDLNSQNLNEMVLKGEKSCLNKAELSSLYDNKNDRNKQDWKKWKKNSLIPVKKQNTAPIFINKKEKKKKKFVSEAQEIPSYEHFVNRLNLFWQSQNISKQTQRNPITIRNRHIYFPNHFRFPATQYNQEQDNLEIFGEKAPTQQFMNFFKEQSQKKKDHQKQFVFQFNFPFQDD